MKNRFKFLGIIALIAIIGFMFVSCGDDIQTVIYAKADTVSNVSASYLTTYTYEDYWGNNQTAEKGIRISWSVPSNCSGYDLFWQPDGKNYMDKISGSHIVTWDSGQWDGKGDWDTITVLVDASWAPKGSYKFGVGAYGYGVNMSEIAWSNVVAIP